MKFRALVLLAFLSSFAAAQQAHNVSLFKSFSLTTLGASTGNDCWGYVSPSKREYALVSVRNKLAFIEVTDPSNSVYFANIAHRSSTWGDVKVYGHYAYFVTEASGNGLQVIDLSNIDNHVVTLVKTIASPGRSHNVVIDQASGYLYTAGSNEGTGTTMCFSLADPANPVQVGPSSMTDTYQHDMQVVTYASGPYAGRQIMFGSSENRGVEIWDFTDKNNPFRIRRISYPFVGYCHQGWLSPDRRYFYVNDEFDEAQNNLTTRTLVFDVSVLETAELVAQYSSGKPSIDHNLYNRNGFIFEANYSSGLRIFDATTNKTNPPQVGWYDTYPADDRVDYVGAWSSFVYFPSGTVVVNDINSGAYILDVSQATKQPAPVKDVVFIAGKIVNGGLGDLGETDGTSLDVRSSIVATAGAEPLKLEIEGTSQWNDISRLKFEVTAMVNRSGLQWSLELWDWETNSWSDMQQAAASTEWSVLETSGMDPDRYVNQVDSRMRARLTVIGDGPPFVLKLDRAVWELNP